MSQESLSSSSDLLLVNMTQSVASPNPIHPHHKATLPPPLSNFPGSNPASGLNFELQYPSSFAVDTLISGSRFSNIYFHTRLRPCNWLRNCRGSQANTSQSRVVYCVLRPLIMSNVAVALESHTSVIKYID